MLRLDPKKHSSGFTLIELLVTVVILSTGIVLILQAFQTAMVALGESRDSMRSAALRHALMVQAELDASGSQGGGCSVSDQVLRERYPDYTWRVDTDADPGSGCTNSAWLKREIRIRVQHQVSGRESAAATLLRVPAETQAR